MAGLCEGGNEPPGSLKASNRKIHIESKQCIVICPVIQQEEKESIPTSSDGCTIVQSLIRGRYVGFKFVEYGEVRYSPMFALQEEACRV
ncbi:hypothetical protein ANN_04506 [Periplaneta americana]|uniref:Uncharacterized protein n=1 Tax=Periplaneta americana TaxID=6978 RepID=A0ABQ8TAK0_PERAM|nr:hypothetical protein ANN_04506 [Periplaneta americana]